MCSITYDAGKLHAGTRSKHALIHTKCIINMHCVSAGWDGSRKHIKCHSLYFHLTFIGTAWSVCATGSERSSVYEEMQEYAPRMQLFPPECEATKGWQMLEWMEVSDPVEPHTYSRWRDRERGGSGGVGRKEKVMALALSSALFTPVATATCLEGTQERRHRWQKQQRGRE